MYVGVGNVMKFAGVSLADAITMASTRPAQLVGGPCGQIEPGALANLITFEITADGYLQILATMNTGQQVSS